MCNYAAYVIHKPNRILKHGTIDALLNICVGSAVLKIASQVGVVDMATDQGRCLDKPTVN
jgi:hypothetical protein